METAVADDQREALKAEASRKAAWSAGRVWLVAVACSGALYLSTMAPGLLWGDSGEAQLRVLRGEFTHPEEAVRSHVPYFAVTIGVQRLTGIEPATVANSMSAISGALTVANIAWLLTLLLRSRVAVVCGAVLLMLSHALWQLSADAEVVTFTTMCLSLEMVAAIRFLQTGRVNWLVFAALLNGIGWSTHNMAILVWPAYAVLLRHLFSSGTPSPWRGLMLTVGGWLVGCIPLLMVALNEYGRLGNVGLTIQSILVGRYGPAVFNPTISMGSISRVLAYVVLSFPTPLLLLVPVGWIHLRHVRGRKVFLFLTIGAACFGGFAARYNVPDQYTFMVHFYLFLVVFVAFGVDWLIRRRPGRATTVAVLLFAIPGPIVYAFAPVIARNCVPTWMAVPLRTVPYREPYDWFLRPWRVGYDGAERYAREVLSVLPENAVLLTDSTVSPPLNYVQSRWSLRTDVCAASHNDGWTDTINKVPEDDAAADNLIRQGLLFSATNERRSLGPRLTFDRHRFVRFGHVFLVVH